MITDHRALIFIKGASGDSKKRVHRLALKLPAYEVELYYAPGKDNHAADLLSRERDMMELIGPLRDKTCTDLTCYDERFRSIVQGTLSRTGLDRARVSA